MFEDKDIAEAKIVEWNSHIVRTIYQDNARIQTLKDLEPGDILLVMDWAMKYLPVSFREKQSDWYGQKGINWHVSVCIYRDVYSNLKHRTFAHMMDGVRQDWIVVACLLDDTLRYIKNFLAQQGHFSEAITQDVTTEEIYGLPFQASVGVLAFDDSAKSSSSPKQCFLCKTWIIAVQFFYLIFYDLKSVLYKHELQESLHYAPGFQWPILKLRIQCFGKQTLQGLLTNEYKTSKSCSNGKVSCVPLISSLCLLLSGDIQVNPGPSLPTQQTVSCIGCLRKSNGSAELFNFPDISEWICDSCVENISKNYDLGKSADDFINLLPKGISFGHLNVCVLLSKLDQVKILLRKGSFDVFAVPESKIDNSISDSELSINGYRLIRRDRDRPGGGIAVYIKNKFHVTEVKQHDEIEVLNFCLKIGNSPKLTCITVYRPPNSKCEWLEHFEKYVEATTTSNDNVIVMGDFNVDENKNSNLKNIKTQGLSQIIKEATRVTKDSSTLIDHIYVSEPKDICKSGVKHMGISDHHLIYAVRGKIKSGTNSHVNIKFRSFRDLDEGQFHEDLGEVDWNEIKKCGDVNQMWDVFNAKFFNVIDKHLPCKQRRINVKSEEWINDEILTEMHNRDYLHEKALQTKSAEDWDLYKAIRNRVTLKIRDAKRDFVEEAMDQCTNRPKDMWSRIKQFLPSKQNSSTCTQLQTESGTLTSLESMANYFNDFFCSIGYEIGKQFDSSLPEVEQLKPPGSFRIPEITIEFIANEIVKMSSSKATGIDAEPFHFQTTVHANGTIYFAYKQIPVEVVEIDTRNHPVKVGVSDAFYIDVMRQGVKRRTLYEYDRLDINFKLVRSGTVVILDPLKTCNIAKDCTTCLTQDDSFDCKWCPVVGRCSDGTDWLRQEWLGQDCDRKAFDDSAKCNSPVKEPESNTLSP